MEAGLAGCALVCTDHKRSGMNDYAIHKETALVYPARDLDTAAQYVMRLMKDEGYRRKLSSNFIDLLKKKIGSRKHNMKKMLEIMA